MAATINDIQPTQEDFAWLAAWNALPEVEKEADRDAADYIQGTIDYYNEFLTLPAEEQQRRLIHLEERGFDAL